VLVAGIQPAASRMEAEPDSSMIQKGRSSVRCAQHHRYSKQRNLPQQRSRSGSAIKAAAQSKRQRSQSGTGQHFTTGSPTTHRMFLGLKAGATPLRTRRQYPECDPCPSRLGWRPPGLVIYRGGLEVGATEVGDGQRLKQVCEARSCWQPCGSWC
jgi:hypothetical protein